MYDIKQDGDTVGQAQVEIDGLYYIIRCCCRFWNKKINRIRIYDGKKEMSLGICVPEGNQFVLTKRIPKKQLSGENLCFFVESEVLSGIPVASGKPFEYLHKLKTARLQNTNGQPMIIIDQFQDQQGSGRNQGYPNKWEQQ